MDDELDTIFDDSSSDDSSEDSNAGGDIDTAFDEEEEEEDSGGNFSISKTEDESLTGDFIDNAPDEIDFIDSDEIVEIKKSFFTKLNKPTRQSLRDLPISELKAIISTLGLQQPIATGKANAPKKPAYIKSILLGFKDTEKILNTVGEIDNLDNLDEGQIRTVARNLSIEVTNIGLYKDLDLQEDKNKILEYLPIDQVREEIKTKLYTYRDIISEFKETTKTTQKGVKWEQQSMSLNKLGIADIEMADDSITTFVPRNPALAPVIGYIDPKVQRKMALDSVNTKIVGKTKLSTVSIPFLKGIPVLEKVDENITVDEAVTSRRRKIGDRFVPFGKKTREVIDNENERSKGNVLIHPKYTIPETHTQPIKLLQFPNKPNFVASDYYDLEVDGDIRKHLILTLENVFLNFFEDDEEEKNEISVYRGDKDVQQDEDDEDIFRDKVMMTWVEYYKTNFRSWVYNRIIPQIKEYVGTLSNEISREVDIQIFKLTNFDSIVAGFIQRNDPEILFGTDMDIVRILSSKKYLNLLDSSILSALQNRHRTQPVIRGRNLAIELGDIITNHYILHSPNPHAIFANIYNSRLTKEFNSYKPTKEDRDEFDEGNLEELKKRYSKYFKEYKEKDIISESINLHKDKIQDIKDQIREYEIKIYNKSFTGEEEEEENYKRTIKMYLAKGLTPIIFILGELKRYTMFYQNKLRSGVYSIRNLSEGTTSHFFPELMANNPGDLEESRINKILLLNINKFLEEFSVRIDPSIRRRTNPISMENFEWNDYITDVQQNCQEGFSDVEDKDLTICLTDGVFSCHSIPELQKQFQENNYTNITTDTKFDEKFVQKIMKIKVTELKKVEKRDKIVENPRTKKELSDQIILLRFLRENNVNVSSAAEMMQMTELDLVGRRITFIPTQIKLMTKLEVLNLFNNRLRILPKEIGKLTKLTELNLYGNSLTYVPKEIGKLVNLVDLNLYGNPISTIPSEIGNLKRLIDLNLSGTLIETLPKEIGKLRNLVSLTLLDSELEKLPKEIGNLSNLEDLYLSGTNLKSLPEEISKLSNLTDLRINNTNILTIPSKIENLENLVISRDEISKTVSDSKKEDSKTISDSKKEGNMSILTKLSPFGKRVETIISFLRAKGYTKESVKELMNSTELDLSGRNIISLPAEIELMTNLERLDLSHNKLSVLPKEIGNLSKLRELDISNNYLTKIPKKISRLPSLEYISFDNNFAQPELEEEEIVLVEEEEEEVVFSEEEEEEVVFSEEEEEEEDVVDKFKERSGSIFK